MMHQSEKIEPYLRNELSHEDKALFEEMIYKDPFLKNEVRFQKEIIHGIQEFRKEQLKARLTNISIGPNEGTNNYKLATAALAGLLVVGAGGWYLANRQHISTEIPQPPTVQLRPQPIKKEVSGVLVDSVSVTEHKEIVTVNEPLKKNVVKPLITDLDTIDNLDEGQQHDQLKMPTGEITPVATKDNLGVKVSVNNSTQYKFHYSFADSKLYLYGDFSQLYEILDFNTNEGKQLYLFYQSSFYKINEGQTNLAPLLIVNDPQLIKKLKEAREQAQK